MSIQSFSFKESHNVRIQVIDGEPWFCLKDVCEVLTIANSRRVAAEVLDDSGVRKTDVIDIMGREQEATFVNEPNLYRVIFRSNKPEAKQFQDWVFNDVLPSIRKTGKYEHPVYKPESHELFTANDTSNLARLIWHMSHNFRFKQAWSNGIWYALREVTGIPSPQPMEVRHIPHIARECERIWAVIERLQSAMVEAERRTIRQLVRKRENVDSVMGKIDSLLTEASQSNAFMLTDTLTRWHKSELGQFAQRH
ncbi:Bro-N domain-containing protein [Candidatus Sodalis sp. SoCistrobi]|uniref:BRO-N domain-containing protein n=1 Tax=Candidatus Sodalis sp. SoCistrobi TaxID=1922216 RepID=UPI00093BB92D|nr:Bro-N domain-containing protein [Candidatus Sodalis sp. SoCistrobi]